MCSDSRLFFALSGEDLVRDQIPLNEIKSVVIMHESKELEELLSTLGVDRPGRPSVSAVSSRRRSSNNTTRRASLIAAYMSLPTNSSFHEDDAAGSRTSALFKAFQIHTIPNGFNSGRTYYLQAHSNSTCETIVQQLQAHAAAAHARGAKASRMMRAQAAFRKVHDSAPFQLLSALVIITVPPAPAPRPAHSQSALSSICTVLSPKIGAPAPRTTPHATGARRVAPPPPRALTQGAIPTITQQPRKSQR